MIPSKQKRNTNRMIINFLNFTSKLVIFICYHLTKTCDILFKMTFSLMLLMTFTVMVQSYVTKWITEPNSRASQQAQKICKTNLVQRRPNSSTLVQHCTNVIQMFCVCWDVNISLARVKCCSNWYWKKTRSLEQLCSAWQ